MRLLNKTLFIVTFCVQAGLASALESKKSQLDHVYTLVWRAHSEEGLDITEKGFLDYAKKHLGFSEKKYKRLSHKIRLNSGAASYLSELTEMLTVAKLNNKSRIEIAVVAHGDNTHWTEDSFNGFSLGQSTPENWDEGFVTFNDFSATTKEAIDFANAKGVQVNVYLFPCANGEIVPYLFRDFDSTYNVKFYTLDGKQGAGRMENALIDSFNYAHIIQNDRKIYNAILKLDHYFAKKIVEPDFTFSHFGHDDNLLWSPQFQIVVQPVKIQVLNLLLLHKEPLIRRLSLSNVRRSLSNESVDLVLKVSNDGDENRDVKFWARYTLGVLRVDKPDVVDHLYAGYINNGRDVTYLTALAMIAKPNAIERILKIFAEVDSAAQRYQNKLNFDPYLGVLDASLDYVPTQFKFLQRLKSIASVDYRARNLYNALVKYKKDQICANPALEDFCNSPI